MTTPHVSVGTTISLCVDRPATVTRAGFDTLVYTPVRGVRVVGSLGKQYQTATFHPVGTVVPYQRRVARAPSSLQLDLFRLIDPGQELLRAILDDDVTHSFRITLPRLGNHYFTARASSRTLSIGGGADLASTNISLEIDSELIEPA